MAAARIAQGKQDKLYLGNLDSLRDWGYAHHIRRVLRDIKRNLHMGLCGQVIDLIRPGLTDQLHQGDGIPQIAEFQMKITDGWGGAAF